MENNGVPEGSMIVPFLFNTYIYDIFMILQVTYFTGYGDDNTPFVLEMIQQMI